MDRKGWVTKGRLSYKPGLSYCVLDFSGPERGSAPARRFGIYELRRGAISGTRVANAPTLQVAQELAEQLAHPS